MSIQRYSFAEVETCEENGDYVLFTDHAAEVERLTAKEYETKCRCDGYMAALEKMDAEVYKLTSERDEAREMYWNERDQKIKAEAERDAAVARAERAEACLRSLDPYFEFSSVPKGSEGFVVQGDIPGLVGAFSEAASIIASAQDAKPRAGETGGEG